MDIFKPNLPDLLQQLRPSHLAPPREQHKPDSSIFYKPGQITCSRHSCICLLFSSQLDCIMFIVSSSYRWAEGVRFSRRPSSR